MMDPGESSEALRERIRAFFRSTWSRVSDNSNELPRQAAVAAGPPKGFYGAFEPVRQMPKGTRLIESNPGKSVTLEFKAAVRFWWKVPYLLIPVCLAAPFIGATVAGWMAAEAASNRSYEDNQRYGYIDVAEAAFQGGLWLTIAMIALAIAIFFFSRPWVRLHADHGTIQVGGMRFDRGQFGGMRIGYEIETGGAMLKNDFHDLDIGLQGLRLVYGPWGEDLPWLVNRYHAPAIVLWMNVQIDSSAAPRSRPISETGNRPEIFE
jgi:hypothetical protein